MNYYIRNTISFVLVGGIFFLLVFFLVELSLRETIVLSFVIGWIAVFASSDTIFSRPRGSFRAYYVTILPKWFEILSDFTLIKNAEEWRAIDDALDDLHSNEYRVLRQGLRFMVLLEAENYQGSLIYDFYRRDFVGRVDFEEKMEPIKIDTYGGLFEDDHFVSFFVKAGLEGYDLGLEVPEKWWKERKQSFAQPFNEDSIYPTGQVRITLATVSYREFDLYWWRGGRRDFFSRTARKIMNQRDVQRTKLGWKKVDPPDFELPINWAESIEHKYFEVNHREI